MKGVIIAALILLGAAFAGAALGHDWLLSLLQIIRAWLLAWPPPNEHFASMIGSLGWPLALLLIAWLIRKPLRRAAYLLAERMKSDALKIGGFLEITAASFEALDRDATAEHLDITPVAEDDEIIEGLLEYAGRSGENAMRLLDWIDRHHGPKLDPEEFMTEDHYSNDRREAYIELVQGAR